MSVLRGRRNVEILHTPFYGDNEGIQLRDLATFEEPVTLEETKEWLDVDYSEKDLTIIGMIKGARETLEKRYSLTIPSRSRMITYDSFAQRIPLSFGPHQTITLVEVLEDDQGTYRTLTEGDEYFITGLDYPVINLDLRGNFLRVTADSGFANVPEDIKSAIKWYVKWLFDGQWTEEESNPEVARLMAPYDREVI